MLHYQDLTQNSILLCTHVHIIVKLLKIVYIPQIRIISNINRSNSCCCFHFLFDILFWRLKNKALPMTLPFCQTTDTKYQILVEQEKVCYSQFCKRHSSSEICPNISLLSTDFYCSEFPEKLDLSNSSTASHKTVSWVEMFRQLVGKCIELYLHCGCVCFDQSRKLGDTIWSEKIMWECDGIFRGKTL